MNIEYSVIIRTTGKAGEKYKTLLASVDQLEPKPEEVIVVLPEGYALPEDQLGYETFYFSPKGMVKQRLEGVYKCRTPYALVCDDDVAFGSDFVKKLAKPLIDKEASFSAAPLYEFFPPKGLNAFVCTLMASAVPIVCEKSTRYIGVLRSTGYAYNRHLDESKDGYYEAQSLPWTCFFADIDAFKTLALDKEVWLDKHGYSAMDDQTMFYKAYLNGLKTVAVASAKYQHLDARTSTRNNKTNALYALTFNRYVFWHRFLYAQQDSAWQCFITKTAFEYRMFCAALWDLLSILRKQMTKEEYTIARKGLKDAREYVQTEEYLQLPPAVFIEHKKG